MSDVHPTHSETSSNSKLKRSPSLTNSGTRCTKSRKKTSTNAVALKRKVSEPIIDTHSQLLLNNENQMIRNRHRMSSARATESAEVTDQRKSLDRKRASSARATESAEVTDQRKSMDRKRASSARATESAEVTDQRKSRDRKRASSARATESAEVTDQRKSRDRKRASSARATESAEVTDQRKSSVRKRASSRRATESAEVSDQRKSSVRKRASSRRATESAEVSDQRRSSDRLRKSNSKRLSHPQIATQHNDFNAERRPMGPLYCCGLQSYQMSPNDHHLGEMNFECSACHALHFKDELPIQMRNSADSVPHTFRNCCHNGSVELPISQPCPQTIKQLLEGTNSESCNFRSNIRNYNSALAFGSMVAQLSQTHGRGTYTFKVHGQVYHQISDLHPPDSQAPKYGQLFIMDSEAALKERMGEPANLNCEAVIMRTLDTMIRATSPYAEIYQLMGEIEREEAQLAASSGNPPESLIMIFDPLQSSKRNIDTKRYNVPTANEVAAIFIGEDTDIAIHRKIVVRQRQQEQNRLNFIQQNQKTLRADQYRGLSDFIQSEAYERGIAPGKLTILPSTYQGSPRAMQKNYQDAMAMVTKYGKPDIFITITCNPKWPEIQDNLLPHQSGSDRPDLTTKVFRLKLNSILNDLTKEHIFGEALAHVYVIEFQKRGLPHCHLLIILHDNDKPRTAEQINSIVSCKIPPAEQNQTLHDRVLSHMIHGPCGKLNEHSPCMLDGVCTKDYPKSISEETLPNVDGYPIYERPGTPITYQVGKYQVDNRWVVPHNIYIISKYNCHANVEICTSFKSIKYLFKYLYKGHDCASIVVKRSSSNQQPELQLNEVQLYLDAHYVSAPESMWRLLEYPMHDKSHSVIQLAVHLEDHQMVYFEEGKEEEAQAAASEKDTTLTAWFKLNQQNEMATELLYHEIPEKFVFDQQQRKWKERKRYEKIIGRMYAVNPKDTERFHLRLLSLHSPGATGFDNIRTVNGTTYPTYQSAALEKGLLSDDREWHRAMEEAIVYKMPKQMCSLFAFLLIFCNVSNPRELWTTLSSDLAEDFIKESNQPHGESMALREIEMILNNQNSSLANFSIPISDFDCKEIAAITIENHLKKGNTMYKQLNSDQRIAVDSVLSANECPLQTENCFFIDGPGGTGKTFAYETVYELLTGKNLKVCTVAWTGIAANLLPNGRTVHNVFKLPVPVLEGSTCNIYAGSADYKYLKEIDAIVGDEAPMAPRYALEAIDIALRDIMSNAIPFGGKLFILGGDHRQVLPVVKHGNRRTQVQASIKMSKLLPVFKVMKLHKNMRTGDNETEFADWLLQMGDGRLPTDENGQIDIPQCYISNGNLIDETFENELQTPHNPTLQHCVILTPKNKDAFSLNDKILNKLPGQLTSYKSIDEAESNTGEHSTNYPTEFLNKLTPMGLPLHNLKLKNGAIVMLLRNLNVNDGLCNGTRLIVNELKKYILVCKILTGSKAGETAFIPRIDLITTDPFMPVDLRRRQFPIRLAYVITINKAQGQTFSKVGLYLPEPVFTHGQLYVAFSRVRNPRSIKLLIGSGSQKTKNIVFQEILSLDHQLVDFIKYNSQQ